MLLFSCWQLDGFSQTSGRRSFDKDWRFRLDSTGDHSAVVIDDAAWRKLDLPHDWSIEGPFRPDHPATVGGGALPGGLGWYRKAFTLPAAGTAVYITFDGVYRNSEVWINGRSLGKRPNGYISFTYDLTPHLRKDGRANVIAVRVDNSRQPNARWYSGSGIYRHVWLHVLDPLHFDRGQPQLTTPSVTKDAATIELRSLVRNRQGGSAKASLQTDILDPQGRVVARTSTPVTIGARVDQNILQKARVPLPRLWSTDSPHLYKAVSRLLVNGKERDKIELPFGIRTFRFDTRKSFLLNGQPMKIRGVCNHHDLGALGAAVNTRALERQLELLKAMGCNAIRTAHNPPAPELLDLCDRMGFLVMDEAYDMWAKKKSPFDYHLDWEQWHRRDLEDLVRRDRNHPSVILWSVGNEIPEQWGGDSSGRVIARELVSIVKALDTTRPILTANNEVNTHNHLLRSGAFDLIGYNYNHLLWAPFHQRWPGKGLIVTESTSALQTRGHYGLLPMDSFRRWPEAWDKPFLTGNPDHTVSAYDHVRTPWGSTHEESLRELKALEHVSGMFVWTGFDYLGEPTPYGWPARSSYFGIIDLAGFPKDVYYLYQSEWTNGPVLHLYPHWNWKGGDTVDVVAYYNAADEVELFFNGLSLGGRSKGGDTLHVKWRVPFAPGTLRAVSYSSGQPVLQREVHTAGPASRILLTADRTVIDAGGNDLSFVTARVVDARGNTVPDAAHSIRFSVEGAGAVIAVDNGDPTSHEPFQASEPKAFHGLALAILKSKGGRGPFKLRARAEGLGDGTVWIEAR